MNDSPSSQISVIASAPQQNDNRSDPPPLLQAENAAAILRRAKDRGLTDTEVRWVRRTLLAALGALPNT